MKSLTDVMHKSFKVPWERMPTVGAPGAFDPAEHLRLAWIHRLTAWLFYALQVRIHLYPMGIRTACISRVSRGEYPKERK